MAKRKTPKVDLRPRAEKITEDQLKKLQGVIRTINQGQQQLGIIETQKHSILHDIVQVQDLLQTVQEEFKKEYGSYDVNIMDGTIKYNEDDNNEADKKDNDR